MHWASNVLTSAFVASIVTLVAKYWLDGRSKQNDRNYEIKKSIYTQVSKALKEFEVDGDEKKAVKTIHNILGEAYIVAPDAVILGIKKIWEDRDETDRIKGKNFQELVEVLRKDLNPGTKLKEADYFILEFPK